MERRRAGPGGLDAGAARILSVGLRTVIMLFFCKFLLLMFGDHSTMDTYYLTQYASAMGQVAGDCMILALAGAAWAQLAARNVRKK